MLIGDYLLTETLEQLLATTTDMKVVGTASSITLAKTAISEASPQVIIVASTSAQEKNRFDPLLSMFPDLPFISVDLTRDYVQVISSRRVDTRLDDLLTAIRTISAGQ